MINNNFFNIKMRLSVNDKHISGSECISNNSNIINNIDLLVLRAKTKLNTEVSNINLCNLNIKINRITENILYLNAIENNWYSPNKILSYDQSIQIALQLFENFNIPNINKIFNMFINRDRITKGAYIIDVDTLLHLEYDIDRGVRVTSFDYVLLNHKKDISKKDYYNEALALATKVINAPNIIGELCVTDDSLYKYGYITTPDKKFYGFHNFKTDHQLGGRIFLYKKTTDYTLEDCINFLEHTPVIVNICDR